MHSGIVISLNVNFRIHHYPIVHRNHEQYIFEFTNENQTRREKNITRLKDIVHHMGPLCQFGQGGCSKCGEEAICEKSGSDTTSGQTPPPITKHEKTDFQ